MSKKDPGHGRKERDVLDDLGELIAKGRKKLEALGAGSGKKGDDGNFMGYFRVLLDDKAVAAVTPSSKYLVGRVVKAMDLEHAKVIVEYGAAEGVMTKLILAKMRPDARLIAIEFNKRLYDKLIATVSDPRMVTVHGDVREIDKILAAHGVTQADVIISGVPFALFTSRGRHQLLTKTSDLLRPGGRFVPYQITTHLIPLLKHYFSDVDIQFEVLNLPPHFVFTAIK
jgi:phospholipid N-methyltransferase